MGVAYEAAHGALSQRLSARALAHSERVAETAAELAARFGADVGRARLAGLLHDWDREVPAEELIARAHEAGIAVSDVDRAVPYLLHGPVAAADLRRDLPGLDEEVLEAVAAHTYGAVDMSPLAMIVYVADVIEPARRDVGVEELRGVASGTSLRDLFATTYAVSLHQLVDRRRRLHPVTVSTWNSIVDGEAS